MITCPHCGTSNRSGSSICDDCGRPLRSSVAKQGRGLIIGLVVIGLLLTNLAFLWWQIFEDNTAPTATPTGQTTLTSTAPISGTATSILTWPTITLTVVLPNPISTTLAPIFIPGSDLTQ